MPLRLHCGVQSSCSLCRLSQWWRHKERVRRRLSRHSFLFARIFVQWTHKLDSTRQRKKVGMRASFFAQSFHFAFTLKGKGRERGRAYSRGWWTLVWPSGRPSLRVGFSSHRTLFYQLKSEVLNYSESTIKRNSRITTKILWWLRFQSQTGLCTLWITAL